MLVSFWSSDVVTKKACYVWAAVQSSLAIVSLPQHMLFSSKFLQKYIRAKTSLTAKFICSATNVQVGFYAGTVLRRVDTTDVVQHNDFNTETNAFDFAVLRFVGQPFPALNVITVNAAEPATGDIVTIWAFGFTAPDSTLPSQFVHSSDQTVAECVEGEVKFDELTHFCAASATDILCPGDTGSGVLNVDGELVC